LDFSGAEQLRDATCPFWVAGQVEDNGGVDRLTDIAGFDDVEAAVAQKHRRPSSEPARLRRIEDLHADSRALGRANLSPLSLRRSYFSRG
jgi:hypothetical protein